MLDSIDPVSRVGVVKGEAVDLVAPGGQLIAEGGSHPLGAAASNQAADRD